MRTYLLLFVCFLVVMGITFDALSAEEDSPCNTGVIAAGEIVKVEDGCVVTGDVAIVLGDNYYDSLYDNDPSTGVAVFFEEDTEVYFPYGGSIWPEGTTIEEATEALLENGCLDQCAIVEQYTLTD